MSIEQQLSQIISDPSIIAQIIKVTTVQTPMQRYRQSDKGKAAKRRSNVIYAAKQREREPNPTAAQDFLSTDNHQRFESLSDLYGRYKITDQHYVQMQEFKAQLQQLGIPITSSYMDGSKRVHRKVYDLTSII